MTPIKMRASPARTQYLQRVREFLDELKDRKGMTENEVRKFLLNYVTGDRVDKYLRDLKELGAIREKDGKYVCTDGRKISGGE